MKKVFSISCSQIEASAQREENNQPRWYHVGKKKSTVMDEENSSNNYELKSGQFV